MKKYFLLFPAIFLIAAGCNLIKTSTTNAPSNSSSNNQTQAPAMPKNNSKPQPPTDTSNWKNYINSKYGFRIKYPTSYQINTIASKDTYPELSYQQHIPSFLQAISIRKTNNSGGACSTYQILTYSAQGQTLQTWLSHNLSISKGFGKSNYQTLAGVNAIVFSYPAGDLVPGTMHVIENSGYIFQINAGDNQGDASVNNPCADILSTLKFN